MSEEFRTRMETIKYALANKDAIGFLSVLPDDCIDLMITDIAYESLEKYRKIGTTTRLKKSKASSNAWFSIFPNDRIPEFMQQVFRVLRPDSHFYFFCDAETMFVAKPFGEEAGFKFWKPLVWDKVNIGMGYHYRNRCEFILFFEKGKRKLNDLSMADILEEKRIYNGYPTEKPVPLLEKLILQSSEAGQIVCDPFMGSGSAGVAALRNGRLFLGNDLSEESLLLVDERLKESIQLDLFAHALQGL